LHLLRICSLRLRVHVVFYYATSPKTVLIHNLISFTSSHAPHTPPPHVFAYPFSSFVTVVSIRPTLPRIWARDLSLSYPSLSLSCHIFSGPVFLCPFRNFISYFHLPSFLPMLPYYPLSSVSIVISMTGPHVLRPSCVLRIRRKSESEYRLSGFGNKRVCLSSWVTFLNGILIPHP
jgi:hypothetical protein